MTQLEIERLEFEKDEILLWMDDNPAVAFLEMFFLDAEIEAIKKELERHQAGADQGRQEVINDS